MDGFLYDSDLRHERVKDKKAWETLKRFLVTNYGFEQKSSTMAYNQGSQNEGYWLEIFHLLIETRKVTGFTSLRVTAGRLIR